MTREELIAKIRKVEDPDEATRGIISCGVHGDLSEASESPALSACC